MLLAGCASAPDDAAGTAHAATPTVSATPADEPTLPVSTTVAAAPSMDAHGGRPPSCWIDGFRATELFDVGMDQANVANRDGPRELFNDSLAAMVFSTRNGSHEITGERFTRM